MKKESAAGSNALAAGGHAQASPYKSAAEELDALRKTLRLASQHFAKRIDMEIIRVRERLTSAAEQQAAADSGVKSTTAGGGGRHHGGARAGGPGNSRLYDVRDMITLLRTLEVKPLAGRRKDLKKIESLVEELRLLVERWD